MTICVIRERFLLMTQKKSILITSEQIKKRVKELGEEISNTLRQENISDVIVLWLAEGALFFAADLIRHIECENLQIRSLKASSYGKELFSQGEPKITGDESGFEGKHVLLIDDIFDTGRTAEAICQRLLRIGAQSILTCFLLNKKVEKTTSIVPDFIGFDIEDAYVFGYGLDASEAMRNLPDIWKFEK